MKLFEPSFTPSLTLSLEQQHRYLQTTNIIAQEALSDFFYKVKDSFSTLTNKVLSTSNDPITRDVLSNRFETLHQIKRVKFVDIAKELVSKQENFKGYFTDYSSDLIITSRNTTSNVPITTEKLRYFISYYINEYKENEIHSSLNKEHFKATSLSTERNTKTISSYFTLKNGSTKGYFKDHYKTLNDFETIYTNINELDKVINETILNSIQRDVKLTVELIDVLIENNIKSKGKLINDVVKKDLTEMIYIAAKEVELLSYLYANVINFYGVTFNNSKLIDSLAR